ncbi:MAG: SGNH hydrolase domain-containing protein, partial [Acidimicrobiales bacterium]
LRSCAGQPVSACTVVQGSGEHILLIGDSHARMFVPTFRTLAEADDLTLSVSVMNACPWQRDLFVSFAGRRATRLRDACDAQKADLYDRVIPGLAPDVIVVMNRGYELMADGQRYVGPDGDVLESASAALDEWVEQATGTSLAAIAAEGRRVVLLEPIPVPLDDADPLACLAAAAVVEECRYVVPRVPSSVERTYRRFDRPDDRVWSADLDRLVCPYFPICDPLIDGVIVKLDADHLTRTFARTLAPAVGVYLADNAILGG